MANLMHTGRMKPLTYAVLVICSLVAVACSDEEAEKPDADVSCSEREASYEQAFAALDRSCQTVSDCTPRENLSYCGCPLAINVSNDTDDLTELRNSLVEYTNENPVECSYDGSCANNFGCATSAATATERMACIENRCVFLEQLRCDAFNGEPDGNLVREIDVDPSYHWDRDPRCESDDECVLSSDYNECGCPEAVVVDPIRQAAAAEAIARNIESERCTLQCPQDCETFESATCSDGVCIAE